MNNSWLSPTGEIHDIEKDGFHDHYSWITSKKNYPDIESAFKDKWHRLFSINRDLFAHNDSHKLTQKQKSALKDHAIMNRMKQIYSTNGDKEETVWYGDHYSRHYSKALKYSSDLQNLVETHKDKLHDMNFHGILSDHLDDNYEGVEPFTELIRKHSGHHPEEHRKNKEWNPFYDGNEEGSLSDLSSRDLGEFGPFKVGVTYPSSMLDDYYKARNPSPIHSTIHFKIPSLNKYQPLEYHFEMPTQKHLDDLIEKLGNNSETRHIANNLLRDTYGL